jgi:hypothetical protein
MWMLSCGVFAFLLSRKKVGVQILGHTDYIANEIRRKIPFLGKKRGIFSVCSRLPEVFGPPQMGNDEVRRTIVAKRQTGRVFFQVLITSHSKSKGAGELS